MCKYQQLFRQAAAKCAYARNLRDYNELPPLKRLFTRKPKDPVPGREKVELLDEFTREAIRELFPGSLRGRGVSGRSITANIHWDDSLSFPDPDNAIAVIVRCLYNDGSCFFEENKRIFRGEVSELGIRYPYSECGVTGLPTDIPEEFRPTVVAFRKVVNKMKELTESVYC